VRRLLPHVTAALCAALVGSSLLAPTPAAASSCFPSGGAGMPAHTDVPDGQVQVLGRGWGHGVGMSQHGALGAARLDCTAEQILTTYYQHTKLGSADTARPIVVGLFPSGAASAQSYLDAFAETPDIPWRLRRADGTHVDLPAQPRGSRYRVYVQDGGFVVDRFVDGTVTRAWAGGDAARDAVQVPLGGQHLVQLPQKGTAPGWNDGRPYKRGTLLITGDDARVVVRLRINDVEEYLYGLAEVPSSWPIEALKTQAIAGRSYAMRVLEKDPNRVLSDSPSDQVYSGYVKEAEGPHWTLAVNETAGTVLRYGNEIAQTYYSSSHGGQSESNAFSKFFSPPALGYLQPVDDTRWEAAADNPVRTWSQAFSLDLVAERFGFDRVTDITTPEPRGAGGRVGDPTRSVYTDTSKKYGGVVITGVIDGATTTRSISGLEFVQALNVTRRSELFAVRVNPGEAEDGVTTRSSGPGRIETAVQISADHWDAAEDVVLATAGGRDDGYADALSAAALAGRLGAPLLLTGSKDVAGVVLQELARLKAQRVHLMGGPAALSTTVEQTLVAAGYEAQRVSGEHRFATARAAALAAGPSPTGDVAVALGTNWPDAVSAGTLAASADRVPTLLTLSQELPEVTLQALRELEAKRVLLIGGTGVVSEAVADALRDQGYTVERLSGRTRFATSAAVVQDALSRTDGSTRPVIVASGAAFPDALAAGALGARISAPIVLVPKETLAVVPDTRTLLRDGPFDSGVLVGGTSAVSSLVRTQVADDLR
jgi:peptidoglycan hydrolase-like amidase/putative cell wall-binding protein